MRPIATSGGALRLREVLTAVAGGKSRLQEAFERCTLNVVIRVLRTETGLSFPDFEEGLRLADLVNQIAIALGTSARKSTGSPLEVLVGFDGYPDDFVLWWDGCSCELGFGSTNVINMAAIAERLTEGGLFLQG